MIFLPRLLGPRLILVASPRGRLRPRGTERGGRGRGGGHSGEGQRRRQREEEPLGAAGLGARRWERAPGLDGRPCRAATTTLARLRTGPPHRRLPRRCPSLGGVPDTGVGAGADTDMDTDSAAGSAGSGIGGGSDSATAAAKGAAAAQRARLQSSGSPVAIATASTTPPRWLPGWLEASGGSSVDASLFTAQPVAEGPILVRVGHGGTHAVTETTSKKARYLLLLLPVRQRSRRRPTPGHSFRHWGGGPQWRCRHGRSQ